jgi:hypothetical protein
MTPPTDAASLRQRNIDPHKAAHFLMKCMFCLFAEDVKLLPQALFSTILRRSRGQPERLAQRMTDLFRAMGKGGDFGADEIPFFNGGLFKENESALSLTNAEVDILLIAAEHDWSAVEPSIFKDHLNTRRLTPHLVRHAPRAPGTGGRSRAMGLT